MRTLSVDFSLEIEPHLLGSAWFRVVCCVCAFIAISSDDPFSLFPFYCIFFFVFHFMTETKQHVNTYTIHSPIFCLRWNKQPEFMYALMKFIRTNV